MKLCHFHKFSVFGFFGAISAVLLGAWSPQSAGRVPNFEDYPVSETFQGAPATPKLTESQRVRYADQIRDGVEHGNGVFRNGNEIKGPNFAGTLIVIEWPCGSPCLRMAIVDAKTGNVLYPPISFEGIGKQSFDLPLLAPEEAVPRNPEVQFRLNSRLMVIRATPHSNQPGIHPSYAFYFLRQPNGWSLLRKIPFIGR